MKRALPFVFPVAAVLIVLVLAVRWYNLRTDRQGDISEFAQGVEIEDLSPSEAMSVLGGVGDFMTVNLENESGDDMDYLGQIRYEIVDGKVRFSVSATLPELESGVYQVWLKDTDSEAIRKAFALELSKGGYQGSAAISEETLPFEVLVSREMRPDNTLEELLLRGVLSRSE